MTYVLIALRHQTTNFSFNIPDNPLDRDFLENDNLSNYVISAKQFRNFVILSVFVLNAYIGCPHTFVCSFCKQFKNI